MSALEDQALNGDLGGIRRLSHALRGLELALDHLQWVAWAFDPVESPDAGTWNHDYAAEQGAKLLTETLPAAWAEYRAAMRAASL